MNTINFSIRSLALVAVIGLLGATPVLAEPEPVHSMKVSYSDLDLNTQSGAKTLYDRIRGAARQVCGYEGQTFTDQALWRSCFNGAISDAVATVNNPRLTALHQGKSPAVTAMLRK
jgi:UrcA family protein